MFVGARVGAFVCVCVYVPDLAPEDGGRAWKLFVCLASMKRSQTNTKPSYTPRKLVGR